MRIPHPILSLLLGSALSAQSEPQIPVQPEVLALPYTQIPGAGVSAIGGVSWASDHELTIGSSRVSHVDLRVGVVDRERVLLFVHCAPTTLAQDTPMIDAWQNLYSFLARPSPTATGSDLQLPGTLVSGGSEHLVIPAARIEAHVQQFLGASGGDEEKFGPHGTSEWLGDASHVLVPMGMNDERFALSVATSGGLLDIDVLARSVIQQSLAQSIPGLDTHVADAAADWLLDEVGVDVYLQALTVDTETSNNPRFRISRRYRARRRSLKQETSELVWAAIDNFTPTVQADGALRRIVAPLPGPVVRYLHVGNPGDFLRVHFPAGTSLQGLVGALVTFDGAGVYLSNSLQIANPGPDLIMEFSLDAALADPLDNLGAFDSGLLYFFNNHGPIAPVYGDPLNFHAITVYSTASGQ